MLSGDVEKLYPSAKALVKDCVASRIHAKYASLNDFSEDARACSEQYMGWTDLASNSPYSLRDIQNFADSIIAQGLKTVVLIGQGGSTQAPMTITKYNKPDSSKITFKTLDSDSPVRVRAILAEAKPETTLFVISSKSGGTIEPRLALRAVRDAVADRISEEELVQHLVAITDPGSMLERQAREEGWAAVFSGQPTVGGRFSALSVFGLLPAALVGIDLEEFMAHAIDAERQCSEDAIDNPAIGLASFLYDNYLQGRNKFTFLTQKRGRVLGLWIEQLVAESLGKDGQGILPNIEVDVFDGLLAEYVRRRRACAIVKGLRAVSDFEYELQIAQSNRKVAPDIDTVFLATSIEYSYLSSSVVKEYASFGVDVHDFIPEEIRDTLRDRYSIDRD